MFACLQINPKDAARLRGRHKTPPHTLVRVEPPAGAPFFLLEATRRKNSKDLPWNEIEHTAGRLRTRMLFPEGVTPPPAPPAASAAQAQLEPGLRAYAPKRLPLLLCLRMAQQVLQLSHVPARELRVTVVDSKGALRRQLEGLVPLAGSLRVFTPEPALYRATAEQLQRRYGIALVVSDSVGSFAQSHVVIADDLRLFTGREKGLIFTPDTQPPISGCRVLRFGPPVLPQAYAALCPPGIAPLHFACALYELCGVKQMERMQVSHIRFDGISQDYTPEDVASMLRIQCDAYAPA